MSEPGRDQGRVAVYLDFDNIVISTVRHGSDNGTPAVLDVGAILDFASSFGTVAISRAYADWSDPQNSSYHEQLTGRAVSLVQLFKTTAKFKNGADIRLAIDAVEDLAQSRDISHLVIVAGDSDYIPLAQHARRRGCYVVGIGVAGSISKYLQAACDEYWSYDGLPGLRAPQDDSEDEPETAPATPVATTTPPKQPPAAPASGRGNGTPAVSKSRATQLLLRALEYATSRTEQDWQPLGSIKNQMLRMEPAFQESALGFVKFTEFVRSRANLVELDEKKNKVRLREKS
ncbi:MAG TPA: NYN domain-containing protein [Pseudoclavibacter sp.]|nr:NYN domain-containing protein [Pseudoclavibacter sp.]